LGVLELVNESTQTIALELEGLAPNREPLRETVNLPTGTGYAETEFSSLSSLRTSSLPAGAVSLYSHASQATHRVRPVNWGNLRIYDLQIILAGYLTGDQYQQAVHKNPSRSLPWSLQISELKPLPDLLARVKAWGPV
jgi:hypothetical protein